MNNHLTANDPAAIALTAVMAPDRRSGVEGLPWTDLGLFDVRTVAKTKG